MFAGCPVYFGRLRSGLRLQRSCPALPAATVAKIFLWNLWTTLETGQRTLKTDAGPKVIVSRMSHPFFLSATAVSHGQPDNWLQRNVHVGEVRAALKTCGKPQSQKLWRLKEPVRRERREKNQLLVLLRID